MDNHYTFQQNGAKNINKIPNKQQNEEFKADIVDLALDCALDGFGYSDVPTTPETLEIPIETIDSLDNCIDDIDIDCVDGLGDSILDGLDFDDIPIIGVIVGVIATIGVVIGGIVFIVKKIKKK
jgi:hypothetical protein